MDAPRDGVCSLGYQGTNCWLTLSLLLTSTPSVGLLSNHFFPNLDLCPGLLCPKCRIQYLDLISCQHYKTPDANHDLLDSSTYFLETDTRLYMVTIGLRSRMPTCKWQAGRDGDMPGLFKEQSWRQFNPALQGWVLDLPLLPDTLHPADILTKLRLPGSPPLLLFSWFRFGFLFIPSLKREKTYLYKKKSGTEYLQWTWKYFPIILLVKK